MSLGLSNLGSIGSERAMAQQTHNAPSSGRFLSWGDNLNAGQAGKSGVGQSAIHRRPPAGLHGNESQYRGSGLESLWSRPMMSSGPSALEQLIRQQQQHAGHDKSPP